MLKWISIENQKPQIGEFVLGCFSNKDMAVVRILKIDDNQRTWRAVTDEGWECDCDTEPTHWMPLPEPPKERGEA